MNEVNESMGMQVIAVTALGLPIWKLYVDGAANQKGSGIGIVLVSLEKITIEKSLRLDFSSTNNEAEYEALLTGIIMVKKLKDEAVEIFLNSRLVVEQINGDLEAKDQRMQGYLNKVNDCSLALGPFLYNKS